MQPQESWLRSLRFSVPAFYIEQVELYKEFKLDEPWDSEYNMKLMEKMPKTLASPRVSVKKPGFTVYQVFAGPRF
jgi:hypothetical protein